MFFDKGLVFGLEVFKRDLPIPIIELRPVGFLEFVAERNVIRHHHPVSVRHLELGLKRNPGPCLDLHNRLSIIVQIKAALFFVLGVEITLDDVSCSPVGCSDNPVPVNAFRKVFCGLCKMVLDVPVHFLDRVFAL